MRACLPLKWAIGPFEQRGDEQPLSSRPITAIQAVCTSNFELKQEGESISGSYRSQFGEAPVTGRIAGNDVSLSYRIEAQGVTIEVNYTGVIEGATMKGKVTVVGSGARDFRRRETMNGSSVPTNWGMRMSFTIARSIALSLLIAAAGLGCASAGLESRSRAGLSSQELEALAVVNRRMVAYNEHDIDAFLATYADDVRIYVYPERFLGQGRDRMRRIFGPQFARDDGEVNLHDQSVLDGKVVNVEEVTIGGKSERNISIYTIKNGSIVEVRLIEPGE